MNGINSWPHMLVVCAGLTLATVITRCSFFVLPDSFRIPPTIERALRYAPACALTAIVAPDVLARDHGYAFSWHNNDLWAVLTTTFGILFELFPDLSKPEGRRAELVATRGMNAQ